MVKKLKICSTAYRVFYLLKLINRNSYDKNELNNAFFNDSNIARTFSQEVILKYVNTLRLAGYEVSKPSSSNKYKYKLLKAPINIKLEQDEIKVLALLQNYISNLYQSKLEKNYNKFLEEISRYLSDEQVCLLEKEKEKLKNKFSIDKSKYSQYATFIRKFEQFCTENQRIIARYKFLDNTEEEKIILEPKSIHYDEESAYISGYNPVTGELAYLNLKYVHEIKQLPTRSRYNYVPSPVVFIIKNKLAKNYRLYENEEIVETDIKLSTIKIATYVDNKNMLLQRLLKYGENCEVVYPESMRKKMKELIEDTLKNYEKVTSP